MSVEDIIGSREEGETCAICGKGIRPGEALAKLHHGESKLSICCSLCLEAYEKDGQPYWDR